MKSVEKLMRHFTPFTFLYLASGVCLTVIAFQHPDSTPNFKTTLFFSALLYLNAVLSTFPFWRQSSLRSLARLRDKPAWLRNFIRIAPWITITAMLVELISDLMNHNWTRASIWLPIILLSAEQIFIRSQIRQ